MWKHFGRICVASCAFRRDVVMCLDAFGCGAHMRCRLPLPRAFANKISEYKYET